MPTPRTGSAEPMSPSRDEFVAEQLQQAYAHPPRCTVTGLRHRRGCSGDADLTTVPAATPGWLDVRCPACAARRLITTPLAAQTADTTSEGA